jgi:hypothetical protein
VKALTLLAPFYGPVRNQCVLPGWQGERGQTTRSHPTNGRTRKALSK